MARPSRTLKGTKDRPEAPTPSKVTGSKDPLLGKLIAGRYPIEQLGLSIDAVTGGSDDVRGALPGLPDELEPALVLATRMLGVGPEHGQRDAGVGFWLCGDRVAGMLFDEPTAAGADRLAAWGMLRGGQLPHHASPYRRQPRPLLRLGRRGKTVRDDSRVEVRL